MFYGESYQLDNTTLDYASILYHFDDLSETVGAGGSFYVAAYADALNLTDTDEAVVCWVVETGPATSGAALTITSGLDPDYSMNPAVVTELVGSFTASGVQTIVSSPISITVAELLAGDVEPTARIDVTAGTLEVLQVKLRAWPPGGAAGAWVSGPAWQRAETNTERWYAAIVDGTPKYATYAEAWAAMKVIIDTWDGTPDTEYAPTTDGIALQSFFNVSLDTGTPPFLPQGGASASIALVSAKPEAPDPAPGLVYGNDPNEVRQERRSFIRGIGGGVASATFLEWDESATVTIPDFYFGSVELPDGAGLSPHPTNPDFRIGEFHYPSSFARTNAEIPLSALGGPNLALGVLADLYFEGPPPESDTLSSAGGTLSDTLGFASSISGYEWYDPTATPTMQPRFYVKHADETMRPVGFGKPGTELTVFRVPGAGRWRDLTTAEYATFGPDARPPGGYPLKVKRDAAGGGYWFDHVGWMVPDG